MKARPLVIVAAVLLVLIVAAFAWRAARDAADVIPAPAITAPDVPVYLPAGEVFALDNDKTALVEWTGTSAHIHQGIDNLPPTAYRLLIAGRVQVMPVRAPLRVLGQGREALFMLQVEFTAGPQAGRVGWVRMWEVAQDTPTGITYPYGEAMMRQKDTVEHGFSPR